MLLPLFALSTALLQLPLLAVVKDWLEDAQNEGGKKIRKDSLENSLEGAENLMCKANMVSSRNSTGILSS